MWRRKGECDEARGCPPLGVIVQVFFQQPDNKIETLTFGHFRSLQRTGLWNAMHGVHARMPGVLHVCFELRQFGLCGVPILHEIVVALANKGANLLERDAQSLPGNFGGNGFKNPSKFRVSRDARPPATDGRVNRRASYRFCTQHRRLGNVNSRTGRARSGRRRARERITYRSIITTPLPPSPPHQTRPSSGLIAPLVGCMAASAGTRPLRSRRASAMHPPPPAQRAPSEGRHWRGRKTMEEKMRVLTMNELWRLTRIELLDLANRITNELLAFPEGSPERANALTSLRNIRYVLARRDFSP